MFERKKLGLLQPNLQGKLSYQGGKIVLESPANRKRKNDENQTPIKSARKDGIYEDPVTPLMKRARHCPPSGVDAAVQTERTPLTPSASGQAVASNEQSPAVAGTSSDGCNGSLASVSAPKAGELAVGAATTIQNQKTVTKSDQSKTPDGKRLSSSSTSEATKSGVKAKVAAQQSVGEKKQTSTDPQAIIDMITSEVPGERYWEMVAAERKAALTSALAENRQLYQRNSELQDRVHHLEHENKLLDNVLQESKVLAEMLASVTEEQDVSEDAEQPDPSEDAPLRPSKDEQTLQSEPLSAE